MARRYNIPRTTLIGHLEPSAGNGWNPVPAPVLRCRHTRLVFGVSQPRNRRRARGRLERLLQVESVPGKVSGNWVFRGTRLPVYSLFENLAGRANIEGMHPHRFRHSYIINALRAGMPEQVLNIVVEWRKIPETYFRTLGKAGRH